jgi:hypothetical protein
VFKCPRRNWIETLRDFVSDLDNEALSFAPHYTIRAFDASTNSFSISLRILRRKEKEESVKSLIEKLMRNCEHETDPQAGSR